MPKLKDNEQDPFAGIDYEQVAPNEATDPFAGIEYEQVEEQPVASRLPQPEPLDPDALNEQIKENARAIFSLPFGDERREPMIQRQKLMREQQAINLDTEEENAPNEITMALSRGGARVAKSFVQDVRGIGQTMVRPYKVVADVLDKVLPDNRVSESIDKIADKLDNETALESELSQDVQERLIKNLSTGNTKEAVKQVLLEGGLDATVGFLKILMLGSLIKGTAGNSHTLKYLSRTGEAGAKGWGGASLLIPGLQSGGNKALAANAAIRALHTYLTTTGTPREKTKSALVMFAGMMTAAGARFSEVAPLADMGLNTIVSILGGAYGAAWQEAKAASAEATDPNAFPKLFAAYAAPVMIQDMIASSGTRYDPNAKNAALRQLKRTLEPEQYAKVRDFMQRHDPTSPPPLPDEPPPLPVTPPSITGPIAPTGKAEQPVVLPSIRADVDAEIVKAIRSRRETALAKATPKVPVAPEAMPAKGVEPSAPAPKELPKAVTEPTAESVPRETGGEIPATEAEPLPTDPSRFSDAYMSDFAFPIREQYLENKVHIQKMIASSGMERGQQIIDGIEKGMAFMSHVKWINDYNRDQIIDDIAAGKASDLVKGIGPSTAAAIKAIFDNENPSDALRQLNNWRMLMGKAQIASSELVRKFELKPPAYQVTDEERAEIENAMLWKKLGRIATRGNIVDDPLGRAAVDAAIGMQTHSLPTDPEARRNQLMRLRKTAQAYYNWNKKIPNIDAPGAYGLMMRLKEDSQRKVRTARLGGSSRYTVSDFATETGNLRAQQNFTELQHNKAKGGYDAKNRIQAIYSSLRKEGLPPYDMIVFSDKLDAVKRLLFTDPQARDVEEGSKRLEATSERKREIAQAEATATDYVDTKRARKIVAVLHQRLRKLLTGELAGAKATGTEDAIREAKRALDEYKEGKAVANMSADFAKYLTDEDSKRLQNELRRMEIPWDSDDNRFRQLHDMLINELQGPSAVNLRIIELKQWIETWNSVRERLLALEGKSQRTKEQQEALERLHTRLLEKTPMTADESGKPRRVDRNEMARIAGILDTQGEAAARKAVSESTWGTRKYYWMSQPPEDMLPELFKREYTEEVKARVEGERSRIGPPSSSRSRTGMATPKTGDLMADFYRHVFQLEVASRSLEPAKELFKAVNTNERLPKMLKQAMIRSIHNSLGVGEQIDATTKVLMDANNLFWRSYPLALSRLVWYDVRNRFQVPAVIATQFHASEIANTLPAFIRNMSDKDSRTRQAIRTTYKQMVSQKDAIYDEALLAQDKPLLSLYRSRYADIYAKLDNVIRTAFTASDDGGRIPSFGFAHTLADAAVNDFLAGRITQGKLEARLNLRNMEQAEQMELMDKFYRAQGGSRDAYEGFIREYATKRTANINFQYRTSERSGLEQDVSARPILGVYTWTRGAIELAFRQGVMKTMEGLRANDAKEVWEGMRTVGAYVLGMYATGYGLATLTGQKGRRADAPIYHPLLSMIYNPVAPGVEWLREYFDIFNWLGMEPIDEERTASVFEKAAKYILDKALYMMPVLNDVANWYEMINNEYGVTNTGLLLDALGIEMRRRKFTDRTWGEKVRHVMFGTAEIHKTPEKTLWDTVEPARPFIGEKPLE